MTLISTHSEKFSHGAIGWGICTATSQHDCISAEIVLTALAIATIATSSRRIDGYPSPDWK